MNNVSKDMIGKKGTPRVFPKVSLSGRSYSLPAMTCNLDDNHFCVLDNALSAEERTSRLEALKALLKPTPKAKRKADTDNES